MKKSLSNIWITVALLILSSSGNFACQVKNSERSLANEVDVNQSDNFVHIKADSQELYQSDSSKNNSIHSIVVYECVNGDGVILKTPGKCSQCGFELIKTELETKIGYQCPPCTCQGDGMIYEKPGKCSYCGCELIKIELGNLSQLEKTPIKIEEVAYQCVTRGCASVDKIFFTSGICPSCATSLVKID